MRTLPFANIFSAATALLVSCAALLHAAPTIAVIPGEQMRINLASSSAVASGPAWNVTLRMANDNDDGALSSSFRRWWHVELGNLNTTTGETLNVSITNSGYSDTITPVWSTDGGATYSRIPSGTGLTFTVVTPPGTSSIRLAKYYPYTLNTYDAYRASINTNPRVAEFNLGGSEESRPIWMYEITDSSVPATGKQRVWIHSAVHPSENIAYFTSEGLINWLLSGSPDAEILLDHLIFDIVPMVNPDGVYHGNYRTNALSVNLENEWGAPYDSTSAENIALRTRIEQFMGTPAAPGPNPIKLLLNLHASHNLTYPFHFKHNANYLVDGTGVTPSVRALENTWVTNFRARSPFLNLGSDQFSDLTGRPFVESMMHDRYSIQPEWSDIMAITVEGGYQGGPTPGVPNTPNDYRLMGQQMGLAIADYFDIHPSGETGWELLGEP